ncbi:hypothetical protein F5887DRAFT_951369 [Amanita rubescens]|nr:hypothetical protein F5887DRAFT_951369 [Amanita rubescens]
MSPGGGACSRFSDRIMFIGGKTQLRPQSDQCRCNSKLNLQYSLYYRVVWDGTRSSMSCTTHVNEELLMLALCGYPWVVCVGTRTGRFSTNEIVVVLFLRLGEGRTNLFHLLAVSWEPSTRAISQRNGIVVHGHSSQLSFAAVGYGHEYHGQEQIRPSPERPDAHRHLEGSCCHDVFARLGLGKYFYVARTFRLPVEESLSLQRYQQSQWARVRYLRIVVTPHIDKGRHLQDDRLRSKDCTTPIGGLTTPFVRHQLEPISGCGYNHQDQWPSPALKGSENHHVQGRSCKAPEPLGCYDSGQRCP